MQDQAKISLSAFELELVTNPQWILTKNHIIQKVYALMGEVSEQYQLHMQWSQLPPAVTSLSPKIARGENYKGLPYVMLDYPRCFDKEDVFAVRSFFWWGHYFSCTLHLKGVYLRQYAPLIKRAVSADQFNDWYINTSNEEWNHDISMLSQKITTDIQIENNEVLKLTAVLHLHQWDQAKLFFEAQFNQLVKIIAV